MTKQTEALPDIVQTVTLNASITKVWTAVSTSEGIAAWFMPNDFKPELGHEFHLEAGPYGSSPCKVVELDPPHRLCFTWGKSWTLSFDLIEQNNTTVLTLTHGGWYAEQVTEFGELHTIVRERMAHGWSGLGVKLAAYIEG
ncbi:SRPBCC domain-containing protein [Paenibacillus sp. GCM10027626]|uniref:SRPBCC family protein n=1 Tax=Paenibacillus sp. GCM10027626 TaxID=3273411 RepID=UPI0036380C39